MSRNTPVHIDAAGHPYFFGTQQNPFNFRVINEPFRSLETMRLIADGGVVLNSSQVVREISGAQDRERIELTNDKLRDELSPQLGRLHLGSSGLQKPSEDHRAA